MTVELDAYERLVRARRTPKESFSSVVRRAQWDDLPPTAGNLLRDLRSLVESHPEVLLSAEELDEIDRRVRTGRETSRWES